nr:RrF2 family transcriptional regulator [bacterium]
MLLSTKARYGLKAAFELAQAGNAYVQLGDIAASQGISVAYLEKLLGKLRREGLVEGQRGTHGGYRLTRPPQDITVGEVLRALEGSMTAAACLDGHACEMAQACVTRRVWEKLQKGIDGVLDGMTLEDMIRDAEEG